MAQATRFTLGDVLDAVDLGLELVVGGRDARARRVAGAQSSEIDRPTRWLDPEWVLLMAGVGLGDDAATQRDLIAELDERGITALGFALDVVHDEVPGALLDEARRRDFPLFTVPLQTGFRDVIGTVYRNVLSREIRAAHRLNAMQRFLIDALGEECPEAMLAERLRTLVGAEVGILGSDGHLEPTTFPVEGPRLLAAIAETGQAASFDAGDVSGVALPFESGLGVRRWLVVASCRGRPLHPLARCAAEAAVPLLIASSRLSEVAVAHDIALRRAVLAALLEADDRQAAKLAAARALACGIDVTAGVVAVVAAATGLRVDRHLIRTVERGLAGHSPALSMSRDDGAELVALLPAPVTDQALHDRFLAHGSGMRVGVGRAVSDPRDVQQSVLDARLAVQEGGQRSRGPVVRYDDLEVSAVLLHEVSKAAVAPKIDAWIEPLRANPMLYGTVMSFLQHNLDVVRAARALGLHPNSVRYRLARAEDLLGAPLRMPMTIAALEVALALNEQGKE